MATSGWRPPNRSNEIARAKSALDEKHGETPRAPFRGWHARGYLPHCDKPGLIQFVTFRLADAMPAERQHEWQALDAIEDQRERRTQLEAYLDRGYGACHLRQVEMAELVENALLFHDAQRYRLCAWVVMPNHVHVIFEVWNTPMHEVLYSWKKYTAVQINKRLKRRGPLWQKEYWDRYMRDEAHFAKARHYVESNPVKARLCAAAADWRWSSSNPKREWNTSQTDGADQATTRYRGGHLMSPDWQRFLSQARPE